MKPIVVFTVNELNTLVPSFKEELLTASDPKVKEKLFTFFWALGGNCKYGIELQKGFTTRNKFNEMDTSTRVLMAERVDNEWLMSGYASEAAKLYTEDQSLNTEMYHLSKRNTLGVVNYTNANTLNVLPSEEK